MKFTVRQSTFETNSSSSHSMIICGDDVWTKFKSGDYIFNVFGDKNLPINFNYSKTNMEQLIKSKPGDTYHELYEKKLQHNLAEHLPKLIPSKIFNKYLDVFERESGHWFCESFYEFNRLEDVEYNTFNGELDIYYYFG